MNARDVVTLADLGAYLRRRRIGMRLYMANLSIRAVAPIGTRYAGFCTAEFKGARPVHVPVYPPHPRGEHLRAKRTEFKIGLREAAKLLDMKASALSSLETGSGEFVDETAYAWCEAVMAAHAEGAPF